MRRLALVLSASLLAACAKKEPPPPPPPPMAPPAPAPINLASVAGMWSFKVMGATGDSVLTTYTLAATADTTGWVMTLKDRKPMAVHVTVSGDSVMVDAAPYASVLRKGQTVSTNSVMRLVGDKMVGTTTAHYSKGADSLVKLRSEGTKMPM